MAKFMIKETVLSFQPKTVRGGAGTGSANNWDDTEVGKIVKLVAESRYNLATQGDPIEGFVTSIEIGTSDGYTIAGVQDTGLKSVTFDGLEATPGVGAIAIGDYVVTGTVVAK